MTAIAADQRRANRQAPSVLVEVFLMKIAAALDFALDFFENGAYTTDSLDRENA